MKVPTVHPRYNSLQLIVGVIFIVLGVWALITPVQFVLLYAVLFGVAFIVTGVLEIIYAVSNREALDDWKWALVGGSLDLLTGIMLSFAHVSTVALPYFVGIVFLFRSIRIIKRSMYLKKMDDADWSWLFLQGMIALVFALAILVHPTFAGMSIFFYAALSYITTGVVQVYVSIKRRSTHAERP